MKITIGQAQANHWGAGGGGKLILPGVVSDETIESNHCAFVTSPQTHYGAYCGPMRSDIDEVASMCGLDCTMNVLLDTHGRVIDACSARIRRRTARRSARFNAIYAYESRPEHGQADIAVCGVFAPTDHLFFHTGWGCMSADLVVKDGGTLIYCCPSPGVSTAIGDFPGLALMDLMKPYMPATAENYQRVLRDIHARAIQMWAGCIWVPIYEVMTRKHLTIVTLEENLAMAADIGLDATTSLDEAFAAALARHGPDAKVAVLPFARYQLPRNAVRMQGASRCSLRRGCTRTGRPVTPIRGTGAAAQRPIDPDEAPGTRSAAPRRSSSCCACSRTAGRRADVRDPVALRPLRRGGTRAADARREASPARPAGRAGRIPCARVGRAAPSEAQVARRPTPREPVGRRRRPEARRRQPGERSLDAPDRTEPRRVRAEHRAPGQPGARRRRNGRLARRRLRRPAGSGSREHALRGVRTEVDDRSRGSPPARCSSSTARARSSRGANARYAPEHLPELVADAVLVTGRVPARRSRRRSTRAAAAVGSRSTQPA